MCSFNNNFSLNLGEVGGRLQNGVRIENKIRVNG